MANVTTDVESSSWRRLSGWGSERIGDASKLVVEAETSRGYCRTVCATVRVGNTRGTSSTSAARDRGVAARADDGEDVRRSSSKPDPVRRRRRRVPVPEENHQLPRRTSSTAARPVLTATSRRLVRGMLNAGSGDRSREFLILNESLPTSLGTSIRTRWAVLSARRNRRNSNMGRRNGGYNATFTYTAGGAMRRCARAAICRRTRRVREA